MRRIGVVVSLLSVLLVALGSALGAPPAGYYRQPALHGSTVVFTSEGDLWKVLLDGGTATRLTSHPGPESNPTISPDGTTVAFNGTYEGPSEVYTMPIDGGLPVRRTWGADRAAPVGWTTESRLLIATRSFSGMPSTQLATLDVSRGGNGGLQLLPLAQAADGSFDEEGTTLFFTRLPFQGSQTKRYAGGTAQNLWRFADGDAEATPLTSDYDGTSKRPMFWNGRVYFASDRDGTMNLWSMKPDGSDLTQQTTHSGWEVKSPYLHDGRIVYQRGADLRCYEIASGNDREIPIVLDSDLDQTRENWVDEPMDYLTAAHISPDGDRVVLTARGQIFVAPRKEGRFVTATHEHGVRAREVRFMPDGERLIALSDRSGEVELWSLPANGVGQAEQLTDDGTVLRWETLPTPDGKRIAHHDKGQGLYLYDVESGKNREIDRNEIDGFSGMAWSPDGMWLAYSSAGENLFNQVRIYDVALDKVHRVTSDRYDSYSPVWGAKGEWLYLLSDRNLTSIVGGPWGSYQPEPYLDKTTRIYQVALKEGLRSPFAPPDELQDEGDEKKDEPDDDAKKDKKSKKKGEDKEESGEDEKKDEVVVVEIEFDGIAERLLEVPVDPGNYGGLSANEKSLFWLSSETGSRQRGLVGLAIGNEKIEVETIVPEVRGYELSQDGKTVLVRKGQALYVIDAKPAKADLKEAKIDLSSWALSVIPREEWRQMFVEAWRLERDYFYDRGMHGVDWPAMLKRYRPLVDRVNSRSELADAIAQMVAELSALHTFVYGGDQRQGEDQIAPASLGAVLVRDEAAGGFRVKKIYASDPDEPGRRSPLGAPGVGIAEGDVIETINGTSTLSVPDIGMLLRRQAGRQLLVRVLPGGGGEGRDVIVRPISRSAAADLRYHEWEYTRRLAVEKLGDGEIGYVHLRAMGGRNYTEWAKGYFPVFNRKGLIIDVRNNRGGNIDSWILSRLLRRVWFDWSQAFGDAPMWNMQYAFRGHMVVLCNESTASDGEAFSEGFRRLGLGKVIGTRTWGGEIWLTSSNLLVDGGVATAAEFGVYGPQGEWLIEGRGVEPDIVVDNLPHATFQGEDAQLAAAVEHLKQRIAEEPVVLPTPPPHPDKSFN